MPRLLFIAAHRPNRSPSQRFRFEQYIPFLEQNGYTCDFSLLVSPNDDLFLYQEGYAIKKIMFLIKTYYIRLQDLLKAKHYDIIFIQREAIMFRSVFFEKTFAKKTKIIFDFDDAIWLMDISDGNKKYKWFKDPSKISKIIQLSHLIFAGNKYLAEYASRFNNNITIIPTTIDTEYHKKMNYDKPNEKICIGWTGSTTTIKHFDMAVPFLIKLKEKFGSQIYFKLIGSETYTNPSLELKGTKWQINKEIQDLSEIDIGIMPLPDNEWSKGKCGFKGLQYMAMEIPTIMSPIGVNNEIIQDNVNGYLASSEEEWVEKISNLILSKNLRTLFGEKGRQTIIEKYSVQSTKKTYLENFNELIKK